MTNSILDQRKTR